AGVFRSLRRAAYGSALRTRELLKKFDQNFNTGARRMRNNKSLNSHSRLRAWLDFLRFFCYNKSELHTPAAG
ncbi:MAG: hypothetical protein IKI77_11255, partial [Oscillospiraceae bacterium]|nr:hypothetical protein [Oscillospiraceae bacterium]